MSNRILQQGSSVSAAEAALMAARRQSTISQPMTQSEYSESEFGEQDNGWDDWEAEEGMGAPEPLCLFCSEPRPTVKAVFEHCIEIHGFDFVKTRQELNLDFYQCIRLINYIRLQAKEDVEFGETAGFMIDGKEAFLKDDNLLRPTLEDDSVLYEFEDVVMDESDDEEEVDQGNGKAPTSGPNAQSSSKFGTEKQSVEATTELEKQLLKQLRLVEERLFATEVQLQNTETSFAEYRAMVKENFFDTLVDDSKSVISVSDEPDKVIVPEDEGNYYFNSYAQSDIHQQMLSDRVRTEGYRDYIYENKDIFAGKTVLDVGCGTGILSMFAARAGATRVYSVDNSDIIEKARQNVKENELDGVITLFRGKIEEIKLPTKVDIIISEWMGYFLLYEAMLDSVLVARERFLNPGGVLAPSQTRILLTATNDESFLEDSIHYWNDVYGFKMSTMKENVLREAVVDFVSPMSLVTNHVTIKDLPLQKITVPELDFVSDFSLEMQRDDVLTAFVGYFDTWFTRDGADVPLTTGISSQELKTHQLNGFTTGPVFTRSEETHWKQTMFVLEKALELKQGDKVEGTFYCDKNHMNPRALDLKIKYKVVPKDPETPAGELVELEFFLR